MGDKNAPSFSCVSPRSDNKGGQTSRGGLEAKLKAFYDSWKDFRRRFPLQPEVPAEEDGLDESIMQEFFDDPAPPAPEAGAAAEIGNDGD